MLMTLKKQIHTMLNKVKMEGYMKRIYLVQSGKFKNVDMDDITGIDSLIQLKYMGAAEFEFGGLPTSLKRIVKYHNEYVMEQLDYNDKQGNPLFLYHNPVNESGPEEIHKAIRNLLRGKTMCKQPIGLKNYLESDNPEDQRCMDFWWDIENDFFLCFGNKHSEQILYAIEQLKIKWKDELFPKELSTIEKIKHAIYRITHNGYDRKD